MSCLPKDTEAHSWVQKGSFAFLLDLSAVCHRLEQTHSICAMHDKPKHPLEHLHTWRKAPKTHLLQYFIEYLDV